MRTRWRTTPWPDPSKASSSFALAAQQYADIDVDVEKALVLLAEIPVSLHCWQGDDVAGFDRPNVALGGGLAVTGAYPGRARSVAELREDASEALALIPGKLRFNLHASYAEPGEIPVDRDALEPEHFASWLDWAAEAGLGLDFNPTYFQHPLAADGLTLTHPDAAIRAFWIEHGRRCRRIAARFGERLHPETRLSCANNIWIPDGSKEPPIDRKAPRERLTESLDAILRDRFPREWLWDSVESKLFGIGAESYTAGSHEFYLGYAQSRRIGLCLDAGHFHPTETLADKISATLPWVDGLLIHASRGVRWDSDHVVVLSDDLVALCQECVRGGYLDRVRFGLDFFDATIHRVAAWVIGARALLKALLLALLEPIKALRVAEENGDRTARLTLVEASKMLPAGAVWEEFCRRQLVPGEFDWIATVRKYEADVTSARSLPARRG